VVPPATTGSQGVINSESRTLAKIKSIEGFGQKSV
jgi:hypothetical protein